MRLLFLIVIVLAATTGSAWAQIAAPGAPYGSTSFGTSSNPPASVVSPGVGSPMNNLQLPATSSSSAYDSSLPPSSVAPPPTAAPNTLGGITTQSNPNGTIGGLPTTTP